MGFTAIPAAYPVTPFALFDGDLATNGTTAVTVNQCLYVGVTLQVPATLTGIRVNWNTSGNGNYDVGIYDALGTSPWAGAPGNLLAHSGAIITAANAQTPALVAGSAPLVNGNLPLSPGRYWLALWAANATDKFVRGVGLVNTQIVLANTNTGGPLPATAAGASSGAPADSGPSKPLLIGILQGGWS